ncbi:hypothetical protein V5799_019569 [Amblyomma americanum]|uniref:Uncharacterized protein n=1 Tax=Amblyomma americanum TaxID=6943 RepID=A0AAQ4EWJ1_AMBAM
MPTRDVLQRVPVNATSTYIADISSQNCQKTPVITGNLYRRFFEDDFGGSFLDGELSDSPFYHQRFYHPRHHQQSSSGRVCPALQGTSVACTPDKFAIQVDTRQLHPGGDHRQDAGQLRPHPRQARREV